MAPVPSTSITSDSHTRSLHPPLTRIRPQSFMMVMFPGAEDEVDGSGMESSRVSIDSAVHRISNITSADEGDTMRRSRRFFFDRRP